MIFTTYYNSKEYKQAINQKKHIVQISVSAPRANKIEIKEHIKDLAPSRELFSLLEKIKLSDYLEKYRQQLENNKFIVTRLLHYLNKKDAVLCCWCEELNNCHRKIIHDFVKKYIPEIKIAELEDDKKKQQTLF